ncbi:MAG: hypothetical protein IK115_10430 [Lachnospiraceae bacterium]|nr:hypothetical protein [Lachnospiraceae bacterium]
MQTVRVKQKRTEKKDIGGFIIGVLFFLMLGAAIYYVADMLIISREITMENVAGDWHQTKEVGEKVSEHWSFTEDGHAVYYELENDTKKRINEKTYTYTIEPPEEGKTHPIIRVVPSNVRKAEKEAGTIDIRVSRVTKAEMTVEFIYDRFTTKTTRLTKNLF